MNKWLLDAMYPVGSQVTLKLIPKKSNIQTSQVGTVADHLLIVNTGIVGVDNVFHLLVEFTRADGSIYSVFVKPSQVEVV